MEAFCGWAFWGCDQFSESRSVLDVERLSETPAMSFESHGDFLQRLQFQIDLFLLNFIHSFANAFQLRFNLRNSLRRGMKSQTDLRHLFSLQRLGRRTPPDQVPLFRHRKHLDKSLCRWSAEVLYFAVALLE